MSELWLPFRNTAYQISSMGRVKGSSGKVLKFRTGAHGYLRVTISQNGNSKDFYVHRLVAEVFCGPCPQAGFHADHIDKRRDNNCVENIRWVSPKFNRSTRVFARGENHHCAKLNEQLVREILKLPKRAHVVAAFARRYNVAARTVCDVQNHKTWRHVS